MQLYVPTETLRSMEACHACVGYVQEVRKALREYAQGLQVESAHPLKDAPAGTQELADGKPRYASSFLRTQLSQGWEFIA